MDTLLEKARVRTHTAVDLLMRKIAQGIEAYAKETMAEVPVEIIAGLAERVAREIREFGEDQGGHIYQLVKIGLGHSSEKNIDRLLERIVREARNFINAAGGTLCIRESEREVLDFAIVQNDTHGVSMGGSGEKISWPPVPCALRTKGRITRTFRPTAILSAIRSKSPICMTPETKIFRGPGILTFPPAIVPVRCW